jgi:hypothetical protein
MNSSRLSSAYPCPVCNVTVSPAGPRGRCLNRMCAMFKQRARVAFAADPAGPVLKRSGVQVEHGPVPVFLPPAPVRKAGFSERFFGAVRAVGSLLRLRRAHV